MGIIYPFEKICVVSHKPKKIKLNKDKKLHADGTPAIEYADGLCVWALNGVRVNQNIAETQREKLDPKIILEEKNAEVRREIIRKIGIERVIQKLGGKVIDKKKEYELLNLDLGDGRKRPYLKMRNPSVGTYHIEGVSPEITTVDEALNWRNQDTEETEVLT